MSKVTKRLRDTARWSKRERLSLWRCDIPAHLHLLKPNIMGTLGMMFLMTREQTERKLFAYDHVEAR